MKKTQIKRKPFKKKRKKRKPIDIIADKCWDLMSKYVRLRDGAKCVTCGKVGTVKTMQAGHYKHAGKGGHKKEISYREENINCQCYGCNIGQSGNLGAYTVYLEKKYGYGIIQELMAQKVQVDLLDIEWFEEKMIELEQKIAALEG